MWQIFQEFCIHCSYDRVVLGLFGNCASTNKNKRKKNQQSPHLYTQIILISHLLFLHILCTRTQNLPQETPLTKHDKQQGLIQLFTLWIVSFAQGGGTWFCRRKQKNGLFVWTEVIARENPKKCFFSFGLISLPEKTTKAVFSILTRIIVMTNAIRPINNDRNISAKTHVLCPAALSK